MDIHLSTKNKSNTGVYPHCLNMPAYQYLINILWWSGGEKKIKITTAQCDLDLEQNTNEKSTTAIRTVFNVPTFLPNPFQRITAYGMTNECCKIYLQKLWLFSPPSTYKLTVNVTSYTWKEDQTVVLKMFTFQCLVNREECQKPVSAD